MSTPKDLLKFGSYKNAASDYQNNFLNHKPYKLESVWMEFDKIKEYLNYVEDLAKAKGITVSGIRFHLIAENGEVNMAIMPTVNDGGKEKCFDPAKSGNQKPAFIHDLLQDRSVENEESSGILNRFSPCPPKCDH